MIKILQKKIESFMRSGLENITYVVSFWLHVDISKIEALAPLEDQWLHMAVQRYLSRVMFFKFGKKSWFFVVYCFSGCSLMQLGVL